MLEEILKLIRSEVAKQSLGAGEHRLEFGANAVRCTIPVGAVGASPALARSQPAPQTRAEGDPEMEPAVDNAAAPFIEFTLTGTASSTSVDAYGTEMSRACLTDMAEQFTKGVEVFVGHGDPWKGLEWNEAIGITTKGEVTDATVMLAADPKEPGAVCTVEMHFSADEDSPQPIKDALVTLKKRMEKGKATGLSIGGWFRGVTYIVDEDGYISRVIINKVDLDHLATTRRPANPDCLDMAMMRSVLADAVKASTPAKPAPAAPEVLSAPAPEPAPATEPTAPESTLSNPDPDHNERAASPPATNPELPASRGEEIDMTPEQLAAAIEAALNARGVGTPPASPAGTSNSADRTLDDASQRQGAAPTPVPPARIQAPAGADLTRASGVESVILQNRTHSPDSAAAGFKAEVLRAITFGTDSIEHVGVSSYREPSGRQQKALWLGLSHNMRSHGLTGLADLAERAAPVLGVDIKGMRGLKKDSEEDKALVDSEARGLFVEAVRAAAADGHPTFKEPGTREAATRALTVSAASDKVTTALVSQLLQQLSNLQLGARTQLRRVPGAGTSFVTPKRTVSSTLAEWLADGTAPTEDSGTWDNDTWSYKTLGTRIKVTRKAQRQGAQWGDLVAAEALNKAEDFNRQEEVTIFQGDTVHSLPTANGFNGLLTLIGVTSGQTVANTTATAGESINLNKLDDTIAKVRGREIKSNLRIFASERGHTLLNTVLQADQTFTNMVMVQAGFIVQTYQGIPIVESSGIPDAAVWNGTDVKITKWTTGATTALVVVNLNHVYLVVLTPQTMEQVGTTTAQYVEFEMYCDEVLVLDNAYGAAQLGGIKVS